MSLRSKLGSLLCVPVVIGWAFADISGKWAADFKSDVGVQHYVFEFAVQGSKLTGKITSPRGSQTIRDGRVEKSHISFAEVMADNKGEDVRVEYEGTIGDHTIKLTRKPGSYTPSEGEASRVP
jgi:hypothetical protein